MGGDQIQSKQLEGSSCSVYHDPFFRPLERIFLGRRAADTKAEACKLADPRHAACKLTDYHHKQGGSVGLSDLVMSKMCNKMERMGKNIALVCG